MNSGGADPNLVQELLQRRSLSKERAEALLVKANNDFELALRLFDRVNKHRNNIRQNRSGSSTPSGPPSVQPASHQPEGYVDEYGRLIPSSFDQHGMRSPASSHTPGGNITSPHHRTPSFSSNGDPVNGQGEQYFEPPQPMYELGDNEQKVDPFQDPQLLIPYHNDPIQRSPNEAVEQHNNGSLPTPQISPIISVRPPVVMKPPALQAAALPNKDRQGQQQVQQTSPPSNNVPATAATSHGHTIVEVSLPEHKEPEKPVMEAVEVEEWDFNIPVLTNASSLIPNVEEGLGTFSLFDVIAALQSNTDFQLVKKYLERFDAETIRQIMNDDVAGFPAMFYVVATNDEHILRLWLSYGGNPKVIHYPSRVPLLAFAVVNGVNMHADTTLIVATLLSAGASPDVIPSAFYNPCLKDVPEGGPSEAALSDLADENKGWCTAVTRTRLSKAINLSQRYYLDKAFKMKEPSVRQLLLARRRKAEGLLGLPYFLIGQTLAANFLVQNLLLHIAEPRKRPMVLTFAGPSGHGKTEMARRLGALLSLEMEIVDCTIFNEERELFGPRAPYIGSDRGSPLNNFLAKNDGQRCIVFMDEFEKTTSDIHKALLIPFDNGEYQDRRHLTTVDCSQTIWILATNAHDSVIQDFCTQNNQALFADDDESQKILLTKKLAKEVRHDFLRTFGSPLTGRISAFVPFLPFSVEEQAVVVHKYIQELGQSIRKPVNLKEGPEERLVGNVRLHIRRDATVCKTLADQEYHSDLGARSLISAVDSIRRLIFQAYFDIDEEITVGDEIADFYIDVDSGEVIVKKATPKTK